MEQKTGRMTLPSISSLSNEEKKLYDYFPSNLVLALLKTNTIVTDGYIKMGSSFAKSGILDKLDREMIIIRVGALSHSPYERMQHLPYALKAGWSQEDIDLIESGKGPSAKYQAIIDFVDDCVKNVKVSDELFHNIKTYYNEAQIAELSLLTGFYMMTARFLETLEVPLDETATSWDNLP